MKSSDVIRSRAQGTRSFKLLLIASLLVTMVAARVPAQDLAVDMVQAPVAQAILPGPTTDGLSYTATLRSGAADALVPTAGGLVAAVRASRGALDLARSATTW